MMLIKVSAIPPDGLDVSEPVEPQALHLESEEGFVLGVGAHLTCHLERGEDESVHLRGRVKAPLTMECGRCLVWFGLAADLDLDVFFLPHRAEEREEEDEVQLSDHDVVVSYYRDDRIDLGESIREQLLLGLPMKRLCSSDCRGLCASCGTNRNQSECACVPERGLDPRLAVLGKLFGKGSD
jgi:uncharacterized metal-binding protein YceD (DUF177 family)